MKKDTKEYNELSEESKETLKGMVYHCINRGLCMGMFEGFHPNGSKEAFRKELEHFIRDIL